jgi:hypothetical protein
MSKKGDQKYPITGGLAYYEHAISKSFNLTGSLVKLGGKYYFAKN